MPPKAKKDYAEIIAIGTELTSGKLIDSNSAVISRMLTSLGFRINFHTKVLDEGQSIESAIRLASKRAGLVFLSGGLGPTDDDITTSVITRLIKKKLVRHQGGLNQLVKRIKKRKRVLTSADLKMVSIPSGAKIFNNTNGMALGYYLRYNNCWLLATPAVPRELNLMLQKEIIPFLKTKVLAKKSAQYASRIIRVIGIPESRVNLAVKRAQIAKVFPEIQIGYQCPIPEIQVILEILKKDSQANLQKILDQAEEKLRQVLGKSIFGIDDQTLSQVVHNSFSEKNMTLSLAESCTGGLLSTSLTDHPGSSKYFLGSVVCYNNESKIRDLNVPPEIINKYGAVSAQCAEALAKGVRDRFDTDIGLSITGIAGPEGGSVEKPVGTVYVGMKTQGKINNQKFNFYGRRNDVRRFSVYFALNYLRLLLVS